MTMLQCHWSQELSSLWTSNSLWNVYFYFVVWYFHQRRNISSESPRVSIDSVRFFIRRSVKGVHCLLILLKRYNEIFYFLYWSLWFTFPPQYYELRADRPQIIKMTETYYSLRTDWLCVTPRVLLRLGLHFVGGKIQTNKFQLTSLQTGWETCWRGWDCS